MRGIAVVEVLPDISAVSLRTTCVTIVLVVYYLIPFSQLKTGKISSQRIVAKLKKIAGTSPNIMVNVSQIQ
jgi:hypothetical protein